MTLEEWKMMGSHEDQIDLIKDPEEQKKARDFLKLVEQEESCQSQ